MKIKCVKIDTQFLDDNPNAITIGKIYDCSRLTDWGNAHIIDDKGVLSCLVDGEYEVIEDIDLLTTCGTFNPDECISHQDFRHLFNKADSWEAWMLSQIEQEGVEKYKAWYARMDYRCDLHHELVKAHNKLFKTEEK